MSTAVVSLIVALVQAGIQEVPTIIDAIERAVAGSDPLAGLAQDTVANITRGGLHLPVLVAAAQVRAESMSKAATAPT
jgi:hypothetical protein